MWVVEVRLAVPGGIADFAAGGAIAAAAPEVEAALAGFLAVDQGQTALAAEEVTGRRRGRAGGRACSRVALCAGERAECLQL